MEISIDGAEKTMPAANIETEIVFPNRLGVEINTSAAKCSHEFTSKTFPWSFAKLPGGSVFQNVRVHAFRKSS